mmetsp:Transcript_14924/g.16768  ORF Transcript_14924/g.16768 Transcript_14924/m.16768 type:complete len:123 (+) Transcript_14924:513-881(+)
MEIYICCEVYQNTISKAVTVTTTKKLQRVQKRSPHISDNENDNQKCSFIVIAIPAGSAISVVLPSASLHSELVSLPASDAASVSMFAPSELPQDMGLSTCLDLMFRFFSFFYYCYWYSYHYY